MTIAVSAIVVSLAAPSFNGLIASSRLTGAINAFVADYNFARSEAIKRELPVTICKRNTAGTDCDNADDWDEAGWIVFVDEDSDGVVDAGVDEVIRINEPLENNLTISSSRAANRITVDTSGFTRSYNATFTFCDSRGANQAKARILSVTGRLRNRVSSDAALSC